jgi:hypothetical protein
MTSNMMTMLDADALYPEATAPFIIDQILALAREPCLGLGLCLQLTVVGQVIAQLTYKLTYISTGVEPIQGDTGNKKIHSIGLRIRYLNGQGIIRCHSAFAAQWQKCAFDDAT